MTCVMMIATYREEMRRAWDRINSFPTKRLTTRLGTIEFADHGEGLSLLVAHGVLGCHVDSVGTWWANLTGDSFRVIAPSRFGYFGSTLPEGAAPATQADAYALLLDHLGVDRAVVIGFSARSCNARSHAHGVASARHTAGRAHRRATRSRISRNYSRNRSPSDDSRSVLRLV
jgi:pimeloyl-ACP methyl ester carboxylesterase